MAFSHKRIFLIPLDSRPVCYDMPRRMAAMAGLELHLPAMNLLGRLKTPANFNSLSRWIKNHLFENDPVIVALDTVAYGGLISSRVNEDPLPVLRERVDKFFQQIKADACFGFSAILRIPAYNGAEEEPEYWARHGKALFQYSEAMHRDGQAPATSIPTDVLDDFLNRRAKNYSLNEAYLQAVSNGQLNYLTYCQDDTGEFGLNVQEAQNLQRAIEGQDVAGKAHVQTGADEVACCMLARWMALQAPQPPSIYPIYTDETGKELVARFDGLPIETVVNQAIQACGARVATKKNKADLCLLVHTPSTRQGDHCVLEKAQLASGQIEKALKQVEQAFSESRPLAVADVAYANGGDPKLMDALLTRFSDLSPLYGYAGWNTPGNAIGTAVAMGLIRYLAEQNGSFKQDDFRRLLLIRLADDWLYQADVRQTVRQQPVERQLDEAQLNILMADGLFLLKSKLGLEDEPVYCGYPCGRTFETRIDIRK